MIIENNCVLLYIQKSTRSRVSTNACLEKRHDYKCMIYIHPLEKNAVDSVFFFWRRSENSDRVI